MTNAESVDKYRIVARHILAMRHRANCGVNTRWFIITGTRTKSGISLLLGHICGKNLAWLSLCWIYPRYVTAHPISGNVTSRHRARETVELLKWRPQISFLLGPGCKSGRLQSVVVNAGEGLQEADQGHWWTACMHPDSLDKMDQCIIDKAVRQWRTRLHACNKAKGGHFKHTLCQ